MKPVAIVPAAGIGTRLRPHTHTVPKALLHVAGKPILAHILDGLVAQGIRRIVVVVGYRGERVREYLEKHYPQGVTVVEQSQRLGLGHAVQVTAQAIGAGPVLIILGDTIVEPEWSAFLAGDEVVIGVKEVADPRRFGVVEVSGDAVVGVVEKPADPPSNLAIVGVYYFPESAQLFAEMGAIIAKGQTGGKEFQLTDALQAMLEQGARMRAAHVEGWFDCGTIGTLLETNRHLLQSASAPDPIPGVTLIPPLYVAPTARIEGAVLGPHVSVAGGAVVRNAIVRDSIVNEGALVESVLLDQSVVGARAVVRGVFARLSVGDDCELDPSGAAGC